MPFLEIAKENFYGNLNLERGMRENFAISVKQGAGLTCISLSNKKSDANTFYTRELNSSASQMLSV